MRPQTQLNRALSSPSPQLEPRFRFNFGPGTGTGNSTASDTGASCGVSCGVSSGEIVETAEAEVQTRKGVGLKTQGSALTLRYPTELVFKVCRCAGSLREKFGGMHEG